MTELAILAVGASPTLLRDLVIPRRTSRSGSSICLNWLVRCLYFLIWLVDKGAPL